MHSAAGFEKNMFSFTFLLNEVVPEKNMFSSTFRLNEVVLCYSRRVSAGGMKHLLFGVLAVVLFDALQVDARYRRPWHFYDYMQDYMRFPRGGKCPVTVTYVIRFPRIDL